MANEKITENTYYYDPCEKLILVGNKYEKFYCGTAPTELANVLTDLLEGKMSLQETYTLLGIALGSEKVNKIY